MPALGRGVLSMRPSDRQENMVVESALKDGEGS